MVKECPYCKAAQLYRAKFCVECGRLIDFGDFQSEDKPVYEYEPKPEPEPVNENEPVYDYQPEEGYKQEETIEYAQEEDVQYAQEASVDYEREYYDESYEQNNFDEYSQETDVEYAQSDADYKQNEVEYSQESEINYDYKADIQPAVEEVVEEVSEPEVEDVIEPEPEIEEAVEETAEPPAEEIVEEKQVAEPEPIPEPEPEIISEPEPIPEPEPEPEPEPKPEPKPAPKPEIKPAPKPAPKAAYVKKYDISDSKPDTDHIPDYSMSSSKYDVDNGNNEKINPLMIALILGAIVMVSLFVWAIMSLLSNIPRAVQNIEFKRPDSSYSGHDRDHFDVPEDSIDVTDNDADDGEMVIDCTVYEEGTYTVGKDMPAGIYYFEWHDSYGEYTDVGDSIFNIRRGDESWSEWFRYSRYVKLFDGDEIDLMFCTMCSVDLPCDNDPFEHPGMFIVGRDVDAGTYRIKAAEDSQRSETYGIYDDISDADMHAIWYNDNIGFGSTEITLEEGQILELEYCILEEV